MTADELIAALERAEGPSRKLDQEIWDLCAPPDGWCSEQGLAHVAWYDIYKAAPFTASIDAALTLVPEGFDWFVSSEFNGTSWFATVTSKDRLITSASRGMRTTPAIALCIAALKARKGSP